MQLLFNLRSDALLLGVLIALWARHPSYKLLEPIFLGRSAIARGATLVILAGCIGVLGSNGESGFFDGQSHVVSFRVGLIALLSAVLVLIASYDRGYIWRGGVSKRLLLWVGSRSYALYLAHIPAFFTTREIWYRIEPEGTAFGGRFTLRFALTAVLLLIAFAEANYRFVETPLRKRGARIADRLSRRTIDVPGETQTIFG